MKESQYGPCGLYCDASVAQRTVVVVKVAHWMNRFNNVSSDSVQRERILSSAAYAANGMSNSFFQYAVPFFLRCWMGGVRMSVNWCERAACCGK